MGMCMKSAIGKSGYYSNHIFVVWLHRKLYIQVNGGINNIKECGTTTSDTWLAFSRRRISKRHMNVQIYLPLGYKQKCIESTSEENDKSDYINFEEPCYMNKNIVVYRGQYHNSSNQVQSNLWILYTRHRNRHGIMHSARKCMRQVWYFMQYNISMASTIYLIFF